VLIRDLIVPGVGVFIAVHETLSRGFDRPYLLALAGALLGAPILLRALNGSNNREHENRK